MSPALAGRFLTTGPPGKSQSFCSLSVCGLALDKGQGCCDSVTEIPRRGKEETILSSWEDFSYPCIFGNFTNELIICRGQFDGPQRLSSSRDPSW